MMRSGGQKRGRELITSEISASVDSTFSGATVLVGKIRGRPSKKNLVVEGPVLVGSRNGRASAYSEQALALNSMNLTNVGDKESAAHVNNRSSALQTFRKYIKYIHETNTANFPIGTLKELEDNPNYFTDSLFVSFSSYMRSDLCPNIKMCDANLHYISCVKCYYSQKYPGHPLFSNNEWYKKLRLQTRKLYIADCKDGGTKFREHAKGMNNRDLDYLSKELFRMNNRSGCHDRHLIIRQFQCLGRISETSSTNFCSLSLEVNEVLSYEQQHMLRGKTGAEHDVAILPHAKSWVSCPMHAEFTHFVCTPSSTTRVFQLIAEGKKNGQLYECTFSYYA